MKLIVCAGFFMAAMRCSLVCDSLNEVGAHDGMAAGIRVASKQELKERIMTAINDVNRHPVVHTWSYKLNEAA
jgi:hypothetical protein